MTSSSTAKAFNTYGRDKWNEQSGKYVFITGSVRQLKKGQAVGYKVNIKITSEVVDGPPYKYENGDVNESRSVRRDLASEDKSGIVNSFDLVTDYPGHPDQNGGTGNNNVSVREGYENSGTTTHEVDHSLGIAHFEDGGTIDAKGGGTTVKLTNVARNHSRE